jgi:broad specificity phosphatase PhoE
MGSKVDVQTLHKAALSSAKDTFNSAASIAEQLKAEYPDLVVDLTHEPMETDFAYHWDSFESEEAQMKRMATFIDNISQKYAGESVLLLSHGSPCKGLYTSLTREQDAPSCGYTGLYIYVHGGNQEVWRAPVVADQSHLEDLRVGSATGHNDAAEQEKC